MVDGRYVLVPKGCSSTRFPDKPLPNPSISDAPWRNDFQSGKTIQILIDRFIGHTHGPTAQLDWFAVST
jgi:hypothetical protein